MDLSEVTIWSLEPTDEQVAQHKQPNGLTSNAAAEKAALRENLKTTMDALGENTDQMSVNGRALYAVLYHVVKHFV